MGLLSDAMGSEGVQKFLEGKFGTRLEEATRSIEGLRKSVDELREIMEARAKNEKRLLGVLEDVAERLPEVAPPARGRSPQDD